MFELWFFQNVKKIQKKNRKVVKMWKNREKIEKN